MKKLLALILALSLTLLALTACSTEDPPVEEAKQIRVGYMSGPTGMGMAKLIHDNGGKDGNDKYQFKSYDNTALATADLLAGNIDVICIPTNDAATNYSKTKDISVLAINTLNTLFLLTDENTEIKSFDELNGKTVYTCKNGTPRIILQHLLDAAGVNATISTSIDGKEILTPKDLGAKIVAGEVDIAVAPEPIVTSSTLERKAAQKSAYSIDLNLDTVWKSIHTTELTMGCVVATTAFTSANKNLVNQFLDEYKASINFIADSKNADTAAEYIVEAGIMAKAPAAKSALKNLGNSIAYIDGADMKASLVGFYQAIGIALPDDNFYYEK